MAAYSPERQRAVRAFGKWMASPAGVRHIKAKNERSSTEILVADSEETLASVYNRAIDHRPPVEIAVWFEDRASMAFVSMRPAHESGPADASAMDLKQSTTIGMLADYAQQRRSVSFKFDEWSERVQFSPELSLT